MVCNNTSSSKVVYDYISGYYRTHADGTETPVSGALKLFQNFDPDNFEPYPQLRTLLIDSGQLESGEGLHADFRQFNSEAIDQFREEIVQRTGDRQKADNISDEEILREVMNTVGKKGRLGESIRCVVSVSMLTEGWDANTVTHVLGVRGFTTQFLCEQVIGRALRRQSYELNSDNKFDVEYADRMIDVEWRKPGENKRIDLFFPMKRIVNRWLKECVDYQGTYPAQLLYKFLADQACKKISAAIVKAHQGSGQIKAMLDAYNPSGSTRLVNFTTSKADRWPTDAHKSHVNWVVLDSDWEAEFCRIAEKHPSVRAYVKNHGLGFEVPYRYLGEARKYRPDFIVLIDDGRGPLPDGTPDLLHLVVEIKGYRGEDAREKANTMKTYWVPGVNNLGTFGRWAFNEFTEVYQMQADFEKQVAGRFDQMIDDVIRGQEAGATS